MLRARLPEEKAARCAKLLRAANQLLRIDNSGLPSVDAVAHRAGVVKGTVYLYFRTKEEIYLALLAEGFGRWLEALTDALSGERATLDRFLKAYCRFCNDNPKVLYLASMSSVVMERNIGTERAYQFKAGLATGVRALGRMLAHVEPTLSPRATTRLFLYSYALTIGMWHQAHPPKVIADVLARPEARVLRIDFRTELLGALTMLWLSVLNGTHEKKRR